MPSCAATRHRPHHFDHDHNPAQKQQTKQLLEGADCNEKPISPPVFATSNARKITALAASVQVHHNIQGQRAFFLSGRAPPHNKAVRVVRTEQGLATAPCHHCQPCSPKAPAVRVWRALRCWRGVPAACLWHPSWYVCYTVFVMGCAAHPHGFVPRVHTTPAAPRTHCCSWQPTTRARARAPRSHPHACMRHTLSPFQLTCRFPQHTDN